MRKIEQEAIAHLKNVEWNRIFAFHRGINQDTAMSLAENRMDKATVLQEALGNVSGMIRTQTGFAHNFILALPSGNARILVRFDQAVKNHTAARGDVSNQKVKVIIKNRQNGAAAPTMDDFDVVLCVGLDVAVAMPSSNIRDDGAEIVETNHQYVLANIDRHDGFNTKFEQTDDEVKSFSNPLSRQLSQVLYSFAQTV